MNDSIYYYLEVLDYATISFTSAIGLAFFNYYLFDGLMLSAGLGLLFGIAVMGLLVAVMYDRRYDMVARGEKRE